MQGCRQQLHDTARCMAHNAWCTNQHLSLPMPQIMKSNSLTRVQVQSHLFEFKRRLRLQASIAPGNLIPDTLVDKVRTHSHCNYTSKRKAL